MGINNSKKKKKKVFKDIGFLQISSYRDWYHAKLYFLINKFFILNNDEYYRAFDLETGEEVYQYKYSKIVLFARITKYKLIAVGMNGEEAFLINIPKKEIIKKNFPELNKIYLHDIVSINENLIVAFHPNLLITYEISTEKEEKIYLKNKEHFARNEVYEGLIMKINESLVAVFYDYDQLMDLIYDIIDITTKQVILEVKTHWLYPIFINVKNGRASLVDNKGLTKNKKDIKFLFMNLIGKRIIDYIYYDDIKYMMDNKILTFKFNPFFKLENKPFYIIWNHSEIIAFNSQLKQIVQSFPIDMDLAQKCPSGNYWRRLEFSDNYFILAFFCCFYFFKIKGN